MSDFPVAEVEPFLSQEETSFLENTLRDRKLYEFLYTKNDVKLRYPAGYSGTYKEFLVSATTEFQRAHQIMRRLMNKSPYFIGQGETAYVILDDKTVQESDFQIGRTVVLGYKLLLLKPKFDIGKHNTLIELAFPVSVKVLPVGENYYVMDEDHVFVVTAFERREIEHSPSHGGLPYHIDILRLVSTQEIYTSPQSSEETGILSRLNVMLDSDEKHKLILSPDNWVDDSVAKKIVTESHGEKVEIDPKSFEDFRRNLGTIATRFSDETLTVLYRAVTRNRNVLTKLLFEIHTYVLKLSHVVDTFKVTKPLDTRYSDLESMIGEQATTIRKQLDSYFLNDASISSSPAVLYLTTAAKHMSQLQDQIGAEILFRNYILGYTSTDSILDSVAEKPDHVILSLNIPPRMPVLVLPDHTNLTKRHRAVLLPRDTMFQLEELKSVPVLAKPKTYRKVFVLRFRQIQKQDLPVLSETHLVQVEPEMLATVGRER